MRKIYSIVITSVLFLTTQDAFLKAQTCTTPSAPAVTGNTLAACATSASFTLTANATNTALGWYANSWGGNAISNNSVFTTPTLTSSATYYVGQSVSLSTASISLPAFVSAYPGNTRGMWFTAPVDFIITGLRVPLDVGGTSNSAMAVMKFPTTPPAFSSTTNSFNTLYIDQNISGTAIVPVYIPVYTGDVIGILGARGGSTSYGSAGVFATTIGTTAITLTRLGMQFPLATQTPTDIWQEPSGNVGRIEVYTTLGCLSPLTPVTVSVVPAPPITISGPTYYCPNRSATLTASGVNTYTWAPGVNTNSLVINPTSNTTYTVSGTLFPGCNSTTAINVTVSPLPVIGGVVTPTLLCVGNTATIVANGASSYTWANGPTTNSITDSPIVTTSYSVTGTSPQGCVDGGLISVNVNTITLGVTSNTGICIGNSANLVASGATSYTWSTGLPFPAITVTPNVLTSYTVNAKDMYNCFHSAVVTVSVNPNPNVTANVNRAVICKGESITLSAGGASTYSWTSPASTNGTLTITPPADVTYFYSVTGTDANGCSATATVSVKVNKCTGISEQNNAVSFIDVFPNPNAGFFTVKAESDLTLSLINQIGQVIRTLQLNDMNEHKADITGLSEGVYFMVATKDDQRMNYKIVVSH